MDGVSDELILKLAEEIGNAWNLRKLALKLGFSLSDADIFVKTNQLNGRVTSEGTLEMLRQWRNNTPAGNQRNMIKTALEKAQLSELADTHFDQPSTNGGRREKHTRKRFRSELSDTIDEKDAIATQQGESSLVVEMVEIVEMVEMERLGLEMEKKKMERLRLEMEKMEKMETMEMVEMVEKMEMEMERLVEMEKKMEIVIGLLERRYTDPERFLDNIPLRRKDYRPSLKLRNGHHDSSPLLLVNSRHDIFTAQLARKQLRRMVVSHNSPEKSRALCHSLAYDWATQNQSSRLSEMQFLFELSCSEIRPNQKIEAAIKDQLFSECDQIDETQIKKLIEKMPDGITILLDGYNGNNVLEDILTGRTLKEVTVMVTAKPRSAKLLHRMASGVYDHIDMY